MKKMVVRVFYAVNRHLVNIRKKKKTGPFPRPEPEFHGSLFGSRPIQGS